MNPGLGLPVLMLSGFGLGGMVILYNVPECLEFQSYWGASTFVAKLSERSHFVSILSEVRFVSSPSRLYPHQFWICYCVDMNSEEVRTWIVKHSKIHVHLLANYNINTA